MAGLSPAMTDNWLAGVYRIMPDRRNEEIIAESSRY
jgi:hypothetical protein